MTYFRTLTIALFALVLSAGLSACTSFKAGQFGALLVTGDAEVTIRTGKALPAPQPPQSAGSAPKAQAPGVVELR